jgi:hypothetical protein
MVIHTPCPPAELLPEPAVAAAVGFVLDEPKLLDELREG